MTRKEGDLSMDHVSFEDDIEEELTGENCPVCGYPIVMESGIEVCYCCGWSEDMEKEGI